MNAPLVALEKPLSSWAGVWKRCLQTRVFGTFALNRDANAVVVVSRGVCVFTGVNAGSCRGPNRRGG